MQDLENIALQNYSGWVENVVNSIESTESFPLLSICFAGSRFARDLENIVPLICAAWVEDVFDSTQFNQINMNRIPCCQFVMLEVDLCRS